MVTTKLLLTAVLLSFVSGLCPEQSKSVRPPTAALVIVGAPVREALDGYLRWLERHPGEAGPPIRPLIGSPPEPKPLGPQGRPGTTLLIRMPSVYLYSPSGDSIYHSTDSKKNVAFLRGLPSSIREAALAHTGEAAPTLREVVHMFTELRPYESALLGTGRYTVLALTCLNTAPCREQNEAVRRLGGHTGEIGVNVVDVELHE